MFDPYLLALYRLHLNKPSAWSDIFADSARHQFESLATSDARHNALEQARQDIRWLEQPDHHLITQLDDDYPASLKEIYQAPPFLFAVGARECLTEHINRIAMVGARKASGYGLKQARQIAADLAGQDIAVVSGLALGIDAACHEGALDVGGCTIAVLGIGCDQIYPKRNWRLAQRIQQSGLIISEYPTGVEAFPGNFPRRNRIVTGMCLGTLVVEAALKSGSLVSARLAAAEGREVLAVPGLVTNAQARGCHQLIRDGASLVECADDVLGALGLDESAPLNFTSGLEPEQLSVLTSLSQGPLSIDELLEQYACPVEELTVTLVSLEVLGLIFSDAGRYQISRSGVESG